jgi:outer membrane protein assembly factor BamB
MNRDLETIRLPEPVERYFREVATMQPPADLMDDVIEKIEASSAPRRTILSFAPLAAAVLSVAVIGAGVWALSSAAPSGPGTILDPGTAPTVTPSPSPIPVAPSPNVDRLPRAGHEVRAITGLSYNRILAYGHGSLWVYDEFSNELIRYDPASGAEQARIELGPTGAHALDDRDAAVVVTPGAVYAAAARDLIVRVDPATNEFTEFASGVAVNALAVDAETLWALDYRADEVLRYALDSGMEVGRIPLSGDPAHLALADGLAWVVTRDGQLVKIDGESSQAVAEHAIGPNPSYVSIAGDSAYVSGHFRPLTRFSISEGRIVVQGGRLGEVRRVEDRLVGLHRDGHVAFLDPDTLEWTGVMDISPFVVATMVEAEDGLWVDIGAEPRTIVLIRLTD